MKKIIAATLCAVAAGLLIGQAELVSAGVRSGLAVCFDVLLPSLFPFMCLSGFIALSGLGRILALPLKPITQGLLGLDGELGAVLLLSMIGGFPTGAQTLASLVGHGRLKAEDASRLLLCCVNPGPAFVVVAVGRVMFDSAHIGWILLGAHTLSTLCIATVICRRSQLRVLPQVKPMETAQALVTAVSNASSGMLSVCAYVLLFSSLLAILTPLMGSAYMSAGVSGFLEVTAGCYAASALGGWPGFLLAAFFISFSGLSVYCQVTAIARSMEISSRGLLPCRIIAGLLTILFSAGLLLASHTALPVFSSQQTPVAVWTVNRLLGGACIAAMAAIALNRRISQMPNA